MVVHGQAGGGGIHHRQMALEHLVIGNAVEFHGIGVLGRVAVVHAVDVLGQQDHVRADLRRPQHRRRIGGEERAADAAAEDDHASLFQMPDGSGADVRLRHRADLQRRLHPDVHALLLQHVRHGHAVHSRGQHAHVVGAGALDIALAVLHAAPEVAAADDDAHLHAHVHASLDDVRHASHDLEIQSEVLVARQRLAADLQQHPLEYWLLHRCASLIFYPVFYLISPVLHRGKTNFFVFSSHM